MSTGKNFRSFVASLSAVVAAVAILYVIFIIRSERHKLLDEVTRAEESCEHREVKAVNCVTGRAEPRRCPAIFTDGSTAMVAFPKAIVGARVRRCAKVVRGQEFETTADYCNEESGQCARDQTPWDQREPEQIAKPTPKRQ